MDEQATTEHAEQQPKSAPENVIESLVGHVEDYTKTTIELAKLKTVEKTAQIASGIAVTLALIVLSSLVLLFLSVGAALWVGELLDSAFLGFFIVAGFYALLGVVLYLLREKLVKKPLSDTIINHFID